MNTNPKRSIIDEGQVSTTRLETLTDGIFAIAMTLLVLEIHAPATAGAISKTDFAWQLLSVWPTLLSFGLSFILLAVFWVAHHTEFRYIERADNKLMWLNLFYLLLVSLFPFSAELLGKFYGQQLAVIVYGLHLVFMVLLQYFIWRHANGKAKLVVENLDPKVGRLAKRLGYLAITAYVLAILFSFLSLELSLVIYAIVPLPYIFGLVYKI